MAYWFTQTQLETIIISTRLLNWGDINRDGVLDAALLTQAQQATQGIIASYIGTRYGASILGTWTSTTVPWLIRDIFADLLVYYFAKWSNNISKSAVAGYKEAITKLEKIQAYKLDVYDEANEEMLTESSTTHMPTTVEPSDTNRVFTREGLGTPPSSYHPGVFGAVDDDDDDPETTG